MKLQQRRKASGFFLIFILWLIACGGKDVFANNIAVTDTSLVNKDTGNNTFDVQFSISWNNSWFIAGAPSATANWDAAWVFFKYSTYSGGSWSDWAHCTLKNTGYTAPSGSQMSFGITGSAYKGAFIYRSSTGSGTNTWADAIIKWDYGADGVSDSATVRVKAFVIEMVYIPTGDFYVGDGTNMTGATNSHFWNAADNADPRDAVLISSTQPYISNKNDGTGTAGDITWVNESTYAGNLPVSRTQLGASYPSGYNAFYIMKYEISQGQYADFLNMLTSTQATTRNPGASTYRYTISGSWPNFSASRPDRACNFLSWPDVCAYAGWAGLRPLTELEFEKACRGGQPAVAGEYAWGTATIVADAALTILGAEDGTETISTNVSLGAGLYGNNTFTDGDGGLGPLRCGIFATGSSTRTTSGAGYYGVMELSGNLWERPVSVMDSQTGTTISDFAGTHGDGVLTTTTSYEGNATNTDWPGIDATPARGVTGADGSGYRGGSWVDGATYARVSDRFWAAYTYAGPRYSEDGGRVARTAP